MATFNHAQRFAGDYEKFPDTDRELENQLSGHNVKNKKLVQDGEINCRALYVIMLMSNCPDKTCDWEQGWTMKQICDQNDIDRPHPNNAHYREILEDFETEVLDNQDKKNVQQFLSTVFKDVIAPLFDPKLPEMMKIDRTDPFFVFRFLQSIYTNYLDHVKKNNGNLVTKILDKSRAWKGGSAAEYKQHLVDIQALMAKIPQQLRSTCDENLVINLIISNLIEDPKLEAVHTVIRSRHNDDPAKVTFAYLEREVTSILADREKNKTNKVAAEISQDSEDPIASVATFYTQKKRFQPRGKFNAGQSRSPISKPTNGKYRIPKSAWQAMSEEERQDALKVM